MVTEGAGAGIAVEKTNDVTAKGHRAVLDEAGEHEVIGTQIRAIEFLRVELEFFGQDFFAQALALFQGESDKDLVELGTSQDVIDALIELGLEPIIFMTENVRQRIAETELKSEHEKEKMDQREKG